MAAAAAVYSRIENRKNRYRRKEKGKTQHQQKQQKYKIETMNVVKSRSSNLPRASTSPDKKFSKAVTSINLYQEIPTTEVSLDDFEEFALDRLKVSFVGVRGAER